ncbi:MAG: hypothetical protein PHU85_18100, partial [Phycisphaerae bacterium]|nr:hypothetical protein [Phycisphaerae bacterium]
MAGSDWVLAWACCGGFALLAWWAGRVCGRGVNEGRANGLGLMLLAAFVVRVVLAATTTGHPADINTFSAWAGHAAEGLRGFYSPGYFADYPPGYIYVLWAVGKLRLALGLNFGTPGFLILLKLPAMLADLATAWLIWRLARRHGAAAPLALAALYAFNPAVILDSAVWGQVDGVLTLLVLLGVMLLERFPAASAASFAAALLVKPQALIFGPVVVLWFAARLGGRDGLMSAAD